MKLSDYQGEEAIELWVDLLDPIHEILSDEEVKKTIKSGQPVIKIVQSILKKHKEQAVEILQRIDPAPIDGMTVILRLANLLKEVGEREEIKAFFGYAEEAETQSEQSTSPTVITEVEKN